MVLQIHINASLLSEPRDNRRFDGYHYLIMELADPNKPPVKQPPINGPINVKRTRIKNIMSRNMETELEALFCN